MAKLRTALALKKCVTMKRWTRRVRCRKSKPDPIHSPPVKSFFLAEGVDGESESDERDYCQEWGSSISSHREYEEKIAALEEKLKEAKADTDFWYWKAEELESHLQNQHLQHEMAQIDRKSDNDVTSQCSCTGQSGIDTSQCSSDRQSGTDKWRCRICGENEARVVVLPCSHLCLCLKCAKNVETCPVCDAPRNKFFVVRTR